MVLLYLFLAAVVAYCLFQSVRFRLGTWQQRVRSPDTDKLLDAALTTSEERSDVYMEEAFLTEEGRALHFRHRVYDGVGILAALALILLWLNETGLLDRLLEQAG